MNNSSSTTGRSAAGSNVSVSTERLVRVVGQEVLLAGTPPAPEAGWRASRVRAS